MLRTDKNEAKVGRKPNTKLRNEKYVRLTLTDFLSMKDSLKYISKQRRGRRLERQQKEKHGRSIE